MPITQTVYKIFKQPVYAGIALGVMAIVLMVVVWWQNWSLILFVLGQPENTLLMKMHFLWSLLGGIVTNFSFLTATTTITIAFLFGIQIALLVAFIRRVKKGTRAMFHANSASMLGMVSGLFGIGCAACGSLIATTLLSFFGASWLLLYLPLHGSEFGVLGIILLLYSIWVLLRKLQNPLVCTP